MFRFANIQMFWLLTAVLLVVGIYLLSGIVRRKRLEKFGEQGTIAPLMEGYSSVRSVVRLGFFCVAVSLMVCALARPQVGSKLREVTVSGGELMLAVDVSNSMLAQDFAPNRLERTKYAIGRLLDESEHDRVGLVVFAGDAYVQLPITADYTVAKSFVDAISPSMVSRQGTAIGKAIDVAASGFSSSETSSKAIILVTDGENHEDDAISAARRAAERGITIYTIGIGTPQGAPIEIGGELMKDERGEMVVSKLDETTLQRIAAETDGAYVRSTAQSVGLAEIVGEIRRSTEGEHTAMMFDQWGEMYAWFLGAGLIFLLAGWGLSERASARLIR